MIDFATVTLSGGREINEDSIKVVEIDDDNMCFVLADGLGGHGRGDEASTLAVDTVEAVYKEYYEAENFMENSFETVQKDLLEKQKQCGTRNSMKTTMVVLKISEYEVQWGHIGDSRIYFFEKNKLVKRTLDHSVPQMLVHMGEIKEKNIRNHPDRNKLLRVMGTEWNNLKYDIENPIKRNEGIDFLLCSDGFWELIDEKKMQKFLKKSSTAAQWLKSMTKEVEKNGKNREMDNYSAIAVRIYK